MADDSPTTSAAILAALANHRDVTAAELAEAVGIGRSTAAKSLALLEGQGSVRRTPGGRQGGRRLPDRWTVTAAAKPGTRSRSATKKGSTQAPSAAADHGRLGKGQLRELVLAYLIERPGEALSPTSIGKAIGHSAGAVGNALTRLAASGDVVEVSAAPRRYAVAN